MTQKTWFFLYTWLILPFLLGISHLIALKYKKMADSIQGRKGLWQRIDQQIIKRDIHKPLIWFHAASAGEYLQAEPVIERFLKNGCECAVTVNSINGYKWINKHRLPEEKSPVLLDYLPFDFPFNMRRILAILQPSAVVHVTDLWPNLIKCVHESKIPQYLISGTLQPSSLRFTSTIGRSFYSIIYSYLDSILAYTKDDAGRFRQMNPNHQNIQVIGDTKFDSALDRKNKLLPPKLPSFIKNKFIFIVGSCWPLDEEHIFSALKEALEKYSDFFLIIAPHEPTELHLNNGETYFKNFNIERLTQWSDFRGSVPPLKETTTELPRVIMVDTVGVLSSLYAVGNLAYVGGAFTTGVHNVIEPCLMEMPVIFGRKYQNAPEAIDLLEQKVGFTINTQNDFHKILFHFLEDRKLCKELGKKAAFQIKSQCGAAEKCYQIISQQVK